MLFGGASTLCADSKERKICFTSNYRPCGTAAMYSLTSTLHLSRS